MKAMQLFPVLSALLISAAGLAAGPDDMVFPGRAWVEATPESQGVDAAKLLAAVDYLCEAAGTGRGETDGRRPQRPGYLARLRNRTKPQGVWSVTKAFTSTAHGLLIEDGKCTLDTLAKDYDRDLAKYYPTVTLTALCHHDIRAGWRGGRLRL